jgi:hypothetical protein
MRSQEKINDIKKTIADPCHEENFLSLQEISHLERIFQSGDGESPYSGKIQKNTGPVTLDLSKFVEDKVISSILERLKNIIGDFEITAGLFFNTDYPHIIHNDDTYELPDTVYKAITLPLQINRYYQSTKFPKLCFFDQFYFHGPSKFFNKDKDIPTYYNKQVYEYSLVDGINNKGINEEDYKKYFTHLKKEWLEGLSLCSVIDWIPGNAIIFDSTRLHCASDFRKIGIRSKLGISIFTKKI